MLKAQLAAPFSYRARSRTFSFNKASLMGRVVRGMATDGLGVSSAMAAVFPNAIGVSDVGLDVESGDGCGRR